MGIIRKAVACHSDLVLHEKLTPREGIFCSIVRDADKVDILCVFSESSCEAVLDLHSDEFTAGEISDIAMTGFAERRCLTRDERPGGLDGLVGAVCLVSELEAPSACEALRLRGYLQRLLDKPFGQAPVFETLLHSRGGITFVRVFQDFDVRLDDVDGGFRPHALLCLFNINIESALSQLLLLAMKTHNIALCLLVALPS